MSESGFHRDDPRQDEPLEPLLDWSDLLAAENTEDFLAELGDALSPYVSEMRLKNVEGGLNETLAQWAGGPRSGGPSHQVEIGGSPHWRLSIRFVEQAPQWVLIERALMAIEAWRSARQGLQAERNRVEARTRELDLIQELGRGAAEARDLDALFRYAVDLLQAAEDIELAVAAYAVGSRRNVSALESREVSDETRQQVLHQATRLLGWDDAELPQCRVEKLRGWDGSREALVEWDESSLVLLPVPRGERIAACLALLPARPAEEGSLRLCYAVANQLSQHLDRILTVHEAEADRFRSILDSMPQAVVLLDRDLRMVQANPAAAELFAELDWPLEGSLEPELEPLELLEVIDGVRGGDREDAQLEVAVGDNRTLAFSVSRLAGERAVDAGLVLVIGDISDVRRMQMQLAHSEKMSSLGRMISGITHELNNPLTSIMGYAQLLRAAVPEGKVAERAEMLESESRRCQRIVNNLLSFARRREVKHGAVSINEVVDSVVALMRYQLRVDGIEVDTDLDPEVPAIQGDHHQLQQVLVNLLTNAQQAIQSAGVPGGTIVLRSRLDGDLVVLEVRDNGPGISAEVHAKVFDPFFTTKPEGQGTGLGLSLVYGILRDHGGGIEALRDVREGACFRVTLPVPHKPPQEESEQRRTEPTSTIAGAVLVVEDEEPIARMICESLRECGHEAVYAPDAGAALDAARERDFDLVIADLRMPGMDGEALFRILAERHPGLEKRLLLTSGDTAGDAIDQVADRTGCPVLIKPFDVETLHRAVQERLSANS